MSDSNVGLWYLDNIKRRDRVTQLANDIYVMQEGVTEAKADMDKQDKRMVPFLDDMLKNHGMKTFSDLKAKLDAALTPEQRKSYDALVERFAQTDKDNDDAITALTGISFFSGVLAGAIDLSKFLLCGHVINTFDACIRAFFILITQGFEAGKSAWQAVAKSVEGAIDFLEDSSKVAKYAARISKFLKIIGIVGVIADAFILAISYFEEKKQRDALQEATNDLFVRRLIAKLYERMCMAIKTQDGMMISYLLFVTDKEIKPEDQAAANKIANKLLGYVSKDWAEITSESTFDALQGLDSKRSSWTDEDPSRDNAIKQADKDVPSDGSVVEYISEGTDEFIEYMREIAVSGIPDKEKILQLL